MTGRLDKRAFRSRQVGARTQRHPSGGITWRLLPRSFESNTTSLQETIMKPIPYICINERDSSRANRVRRKHQSGPLTDYFYQSSPNPGGSSSPISGDAFRISRLRMFRKLSSDFFGAEAGRDYFAELAVFSLITAVSAWPVISMVVALYRMIK